MSNLKNIAELGVRYSVPIIRWMVMVSLSCFGVVYGSDAGVVKSSSLLASRTNRLVIDSFLVTPTSRVFGIGWEPGLQHYMPTLDLLCKSDLVEDWRIFASVDVGDASSNRVVLEVVNDSLPGGSYFDCGFFGARMSEDPNDLDGDGWLNEDDEDPLVWNECGDLLFQELPDGANPNAYYWIDVVSDANTRVRFTGDGYSDLDDPVFTLPRGETNRVTLLIGKAYSVQSDRPLSVVASSSTSVSVIGNGSRNLSVVVPLNIYALEGNGASFAMRTDNTKITGVYIWNGCCPITAHGNTFWYAHSWSCFCSGCYADGRYVYEGYAKSCSGGYCCCGRGDEDEEIVTAVDDEPYAPSVSVSFSDPVVIFEDAYTNSPGKVVARRSTQTTLHCVAHGGELGGRMEFDLDDGGKLTNAVGTITSINSIIVPPCQKIEFDLVLEGVRPSSSVDDIRAYARFHYNGASRKLESEDRLTSVKVEIMAIYEAPENKNPSRHVYGVGEKVRFRVAPTLQEVRITTRKLDRWDYGYLYELFDEDSESVGGGAEHIYICPISSSFIPPIKVSYKGVEYLPQFEIIDPQYVLTAGADWASSFASGIVGQGYLITTNYIGPMSVSFQGIMVAEIPCEDEIPPSGYFASSSFTGYRSHTYDAEAGRAVRIQTRNRWTIDEAGGGLYQNWSPGRLEWKIPIGWLRISGDDSQFGNVTEAEHEQYGVRASRPLLIGGVIDKYNQVMTIDEDGASKVEKFGHWLLRSQKDEIILDGERKK